MGCSDNSEEVNNLNLELSKLKEELKEKDDELSKKSDEITLLSTKNQELQLQVYKAKPWFELSEQEQKQKEIELAKARSQKVLRVDDIETIYLKLLEFNCVDEKTKEAYIRSIQNR